MISNIIRKIQQLLSGKSATVCCFIIALLSKTVLMRHFLNVGTDKAALLISTKNLLGGHGISIGRTYATDLAEKVYVPYTGWPPGYSVLLSPFLSLFPDNFMLAAFCIDVLAAVIFFVYLFKIMRQLGFPVWLSNLFLLFQGFFLTEYIGTSYATDFLSMSFALAGWYYCSRLFTAEVKWPSLLLCAIAFTVASSIRYQYIPVCAGGLLWPLYQGFNKKQRKLFVAAALSLVVLGVAVGGILYFQKITSGSYVYQIPDVKKGWYPENILVTNPFSVHAVIELDFWGVQLSSITGISYPTWMLVFRLLAVVVMIALGLMAFKWLRKYFIEGFTPQAHVWMIGGLLSVYTIGLLMYLAATNSPQKGFDNWTFVTNGRYFALPMIFIQLALWRWLSVVTFSNRIKDFFAGVLISLFIFSGVHGAYMVAKSISKPFTPFSAILPAQPEMKTMLEFINEEKKKNPTITIVAGGTDNQFGYFADWYGVNAIFAPTDLSVVTLRTTKPVILFIAIPKITGSSYEWLVSRHGMSLYKEDNKWFYYTLQAEPSK
jgi:hypothetical protein